MYGVLVGGCPWMDLPWVISFRRAGEASTPDLSSNEQHPDDQRLNNLISQLKEVEIESISTSERLMFPASRVDYFFSASTPTPPVLSSETPRIIQKYCSLFSKWVEPHQERMQEYFLNENNEGVLFHIDDLLQVINEWGELPEVTRLFHQVKHDGEFYNHRSVMQFALYCWVLFGAGRSRFQRVDTHPMLYGKRQPVQYPIMFASQSRQTTPLEPVQEKPMHSTAVSSLHKRALSEPEKLQLDAIIDGKLPSTGTRTSFTGPVFAVDSTKNGESEDAIAVGDVEGEGRWIHVHISDVVHAVPYQSPLDHFARQFPVKVYTNKKTFGMLPETLGAFLSFRCLKNTKKVVPTICFSALIHEVTGEVLRYQVSHSQIARDDFHLLSFEEADQRYHSGDERMKELVHYGNLVKKQRTRVLPDFDRFVSASAKDSYEVVDSTLTHTVREWMLLSGVIAGNVADQLGLSMAYRENLGPNIDDTLSRTQPPSQKNITTKKGVIVSTDPIAFRHYAPVSSPLRKYHDLLNHHQLSRMLAFNEVIPRPALKRHLNDVKKRMRQNESIQKRSFRFKDLNRLESEVGAGGLVNGKVVELRPGVVSGRHAIQALVRIEGYKNLTVPVKMNPRHAKEGEIYSFRVDRIQLEQDLLVLQPEKKE